MKQFIETMVANGFPDYHFIAAEKRVQRSWSDLMKTDIVKKYLAVNGIDPEAIDYLTTAELAYDYVEQHIPAQYTEPDEAGEECGCWHDETYEMWNQAFISYVEAHCLVAYEIDPEGFIAKAQNIKTINQN